MSDEILRNQSLSPVYTPSDRKLRCGHNILAPGPRSAVDSTWQRETMDAKVFDWDLAVNILLFEGATEACAGLAEDWGETRGWILRGGKPIARSESYTYLASQWATPVLKIGDTVYDCFQLQSLAPELDAYTFWPEEAKAAWLAGRSRPRPRPRFKGIRAANFSLEVEELEDEG